MEPQFADTLGVWLTPAVLIAVPLVVLGAMQNLKKDLRREMDAIRQENAVFRQEVDERFDKVDERFREVDKRFVVLEKKSVEASKGRDGRVSSYYVEALDRRTWSYVRLRVSDHDVPETWDRTMRAEAEVRTFDGSADLYASAAPRRRDLWWKRAFLVAFGRRGVRPRSFTLRRESVG